MCRYAATVWRLTADAPTTGIRSVAEGTRSGAVGLNMASFGSCCCREGFAKFAGKRSRCSRGGGAELSRREAAWRAESGVRLLEHGGSKPRQQSILSRTDVSCRTNRRR